MDIREVLKGKNLIFDGAFGTYYAHKTGLGALPELANISDSQTVKEIHKEYIQAGADIIRTNTFASNRKSLECTKEEQKSNLVKACELAKAAVEETGKTVFIAGDIGPVSGEYERLSGETLDEYLFMANTLIEAGVDLLLFETFSDYHKILPVIEQIKAKNPHICIFLHFSMNQYGYTNGGISVRKIFSELSDNRCIDGLGVNCGVGPGHMLKLCKNLPMSADKFYSALPNASYPKLIKDRIVFMENKEYFARKVAEFAEIGADCVGGCCGTTPEYIKELSTAFVRDKKDRDNTADTLKGYPGKNMPRHAFYGEDNKNGNRDKLIAVELAPPFGADDEKILDAANYLRGLNVDVITFPDSPSGRTRADSILMGVKAQENSGMTVMPHICCRDKNAIAIRSQLLGAYMNGIRNMLVVTGDPVPSMLRGNVKSVYNFDSVGLMRIIQEMNEDEFADDPFVYGGALNPGRINVQIEIDRTRKKIDAGATFFLTQPLFTDEDIDRLSQIKSAISDKENVKVLCGIMPLVSLKNALFIKNEMTGINVTDEIVARYKDADTREMGEFVGISLAKEIMEKTKELSDGYYYSIPFNRVGMLNHILV